MAPTSTSPRTMTANLVAGFRRRAIIQLTCPSFRSVDDVDNHEQADPHHVDEVPVIRHDDGADLLLIGESSRGERASEYKQKCDQPTRHVQTVETDGQEEHR